MQKKVTTGASNIIVKAESLDQFFAYNAKPFLKWAGGKTQLLQKFRELYPKQLIEGKIKKLPWCEESELEQEINQVKDILFQLNSHNIFTINSLSLFIITTLPYYYLLIILGTLVPVNGNTRPSYECVKYLIIS